MNCIFCKIINKDIPASIVYEDEKVLAFNDVNPQAPVHILFIPKEHIGGLVELQNTAIIDNLFKVMKRIAAEQGLDQSGYRIVVNQGPDAGQAVGHLHFHLLAKRKLTWPPG